MMQADVVVPHKMLLPVLFDIYEAGYQQRWPTLWEPMLELYRVRELPEYARIIDAEERVGRYSGRKRANESTAVKGPLPDGSAAVKKKTK
jgi:hypothetical protein